MKKFIKFFILIFVLLAISFNCMSFDDCRVVRNQTFINCIKEKIIFFTPNISSFDFRCVVLVINTQKDKVSIFVPILNSDRNEIVKEAVIPMAIEGAASTKDIFDALVSGTDSIRWSRDFDVKFLKVKNVYKYWCGMYLSSALQPLITLGTDDRVFYMLPPDGSFANLRVVVEGDGKASQSFVFQKNGELKPVNSTPSVVHAGFFENLLDAVRGYFLKQEGYARVLTDDSRDAKLKSE